MYIHSTLVCTPHPSLSACVFRFQCWLMSLCYKCVCVFVVYVFVCVFMCLCVRACVFCFCCVPIPAMFSWGFGFSRGLAICTCTRTCDSPLPRSWRRNSCPMAVLSLSGNDCSSCGPSVDPVCRSAMASLATLRLAKPSLQWPLLATVS